MLNITSLTLELELVLLNLDRLVELVLILTFGFDLSTKSSARQAASSVSLVISMLSRAIRVVVLDRFGCLLVLIN